MKLFMGVLFATLALNGVLSLPARTEDAEVIGGPRRILTRADDDDDDDFTNFKGVIDTGSGYPFLQPNPSVIRVGFFDSFDDLFRRFSERLFPSSFFSRAGTDSAEDDSSELGLPAIDPKKANSTSTVKVVDGHKVEVNETVYGDETSVFKVRVVNIRPLEDGETVEETENKDVKPVTQGPQEKAPDNESKESDENREPLEKKPTENEIQGNIDEPEHSIAKKENIVETTGDTTITTETTIDTTMLPTTEDINAAFVTDNGLERGEEVDDEEGYTTANVAEDEEELNGDNGNGNNEFETNMSEENNSNNDAADDNIDNVENLQVEHTIENNEDTEEEVNDNLNESSSSSNADVYGNNNQENNDNNADVVDDATAEAGAEADIEIVNLKKKNSNYLAAIRNKEREGESSSDDEDANASAAFEMHPTFNDEWGSLNEPTNEQNDFSNDIDAYDVIPIDLSNDIAVNDAANLPLNPDAEFIDVYGVQHSSNSMPKFEKLSLDNQPPTSAEEWSNTPAK